MPITRSITVPLSQISAPGGTPVPTSLNFKLIDGGNVVFETNQPVPNPAAASIAVSITAPNPGNYILRTQAESVTGGTAVGAARDQDEAFLAPVTITVPTPG
jgi:hypothetical protein